MPQLSNVYPVIMAGGSGTRFWPLSRQSLPKQFLSLVSRRSMITETYERVKGLSTPKNVFVVCGPAHSKLVTKHLTKVPKTNILVEPVARNTAPAIALATMSVLKKDPNGVVVVVASDQHVQNVPAFHTAIAEAVEIANQQFIVTLGIRPTRPETGYGYIRSGEKLSGTASRVAAFVEKPNRETAQQYLESGQYLWNAGIFVFRADVMAQAFREHLPDVWSVFELISSAKDAKKAALVLKKKFPTLPSISIDYGIAEKAKNIAVVPCDCGWSDVGSFNTLPEVRQRDESGNVLIGEHGIVLDSKDTVVVSDKRPIAVVGMSGVVVVDAGDAVLVLPQERSQDVRLVVEALKAKKLKKYL